MRAYIQYSRDIASRVFILSLMARTPSIVHEALAARPRLNGFVGFRRNAPEPVGASTVEHVKANVPESQLLMHEMQTTGDAKRPNRHSR